MSFNFTVKEFILGGGTGTPTFQFYKRGFNLQDNGSTPSWQDIILSGNGSLTLTNAKANGLNYVKLFGGTSQRNLPVGYTEYSDIRNTSANSSNQIDLDIIDDVDDMVYELDVENPATGSWYILQSRESSNQNICGISGSQTGNYISAGVRGTSLSAKNGSDYVVRNGSGHYFIRFVHKNGSQSLTVTDLNTSTVYTDSSTYTYTAATVPLCVFCNNLGNAVAAGNKVKHIRIYKSGELARDLYPANDSTDGGLYDKANDRMFLPVAETYIELDDAVTTPTPDHPIDIVCNNGVLKYGNVSKNLFDEDYGELGSSFVYKPLYLGVGTYTCSYSLPHDENGTSMVYFLNGNVSGGASNRQNQVDASTPRTITTSTGYVTLAYRKGSSIGLTDKVPSDYDCMIEQGSRATTYEPYRLDVYTDGTQEVVTDSLGNTASAEMLLAVGDYKDTQEILSGAVSRSIGIKVLDGSESWTLSNSPYEGTNRNLFYTLISDALGDTTGICSIASFTTAQTSTVSAPVCRLTGTKNLNIIPFSDTTTIPTVDAWKQYLANQYANGTPVIVVYPLQTPTEETVTAQPLSIQAGTNIVEITQASINNLELEVSYKGTV